MSCILFHLRVSSERKNVHTHFVYAGTGPDKCNFHENPRIHANAFSKRIVHMCMRAERSHEKTRDARGASRRRRSIQSTVENKVGVNAMNDQILQPKDCLSTTMTDMDIMTSRDSFHREEEIIFFNSDEFMIDLLRPPVTRSQQNHSLEFAANSVSPVIESPNEKPKKCMEQSRSLEKRLSFTTRFSDGVVIKPKPRSRKSQKTFSPIFNKGSLVVLGKKEDERPRSKSFVFAIPKHSKSASPAKKKTLASSLSPGLSIRRSRTFDCVLSEDQTTSDIIEVSKAADKKPSWLVPAPPLTASPSLSKATRKVRKSAMGRMESDSSIDSSMIESPKPMKPKASSWLVPPRAVVVPPVSPSRSPSQHDGSQRSTRSRNKSSSRRKRSVNTADEAPTSEKHKSGWLLSPAMALATPRSARKSGKSNKSSKTVASELLPPIPDLDMDGVGAVKKSSFLKRPTFLRPLDKLLVRGDIGSATTATTFFTADTDAIDYSMSHLLPRTKKTEKIIFKRVANTKKKELSIENSEGEKIAYLDYSQANDGKRFLKDVHGRFCAVIIHQSDKTDGNNVFKICGNRPASRTQRLSNETGYYTWAEVRNSGSLGGKFCMKRYCEGTLSCSMDDHVTKPFGSLFNTRKSRGYAFLDSKKKECVKMVILNRGGKGIMVAPERDMCLMLAFAAVVDEMLENRMR